MLKSALKIAVLFLFVGCASTQKFSDYSFKTKKDKDSYTKSYNKSLKLWDIPYTEEDVKTSLGTAHVIISGPKNGKNLILLHGMDASSTMWYPNIKALAKDHRVYAIDFLLEPNKSVSTGKSLSADDIVIWYNEIFDHYKLKKFDIIGASRGGWITTLLASQKQNSINRIILLSPAQTFQFIDKLGKTSSALMLKLFPNEKKFGKTLSTFSTHPEKISPIYKRQFYLANKYAKSNSSMLKMTPFSEKELGMVQNQVLVLVGDHDVINGAESVERVKKYLVNGKIKVIKDAGHFLSIDQSKIVNDAMIEFLK
ncbi:alpha/beta fold hydrolase [Flavobacterium hungaricum]|uniref:Alpha/beta hydrolase n=1 Tax=Flavobacterium hungaricum TaxID=2082725 RepID=A0ABR9TDX6_9FLAO|nr:alpha/beta hydrolase [Flavobacterium hungaricum]MBE8723568.1 alpha/beta hydrolase [Flavobacterium hungaricum]